MSGDAESTRGAQQHPGPKPDVKRGTPETPNPVGICPSCGDRHEATAAHQARARARACCNPDLEERTATYINVPAHPTRLAHPDVPSRQDAIADTNLDPETATLVDKDVITAGDGWEVTYTLVGYDALADTDDEPADGQPTEDNQ